MTNESVQYSTETHFKLAKKRGGCRSQRQQQRCLLPKVITLSASQPSSSKKPYFFALSQRIRRCITRVSRLFYATNTIVALSENPFILAWNIWRQARWWLWDCLMCHPKAYWKVSLFRTTTGEKFEIRYINVVRVESSGFWSYIHTHDAMVVEKSLPYYIFLRSSSSPVGFCIFQFPAELAMHFRIQINFFFRVSFCWNLPFLDLMTQVHLVLTYL